MTEHRSGSTPTQQTDRAQGEMRTSVGVLRSLLSALPEEATAAGMCKLRLGTDARVGTGAGARTITPHQGTAHGMAVVTLTRDVARAIVEWLGSCGPRQRVWVWAGRRTLGLWLAADESQELEFPLQRGPGCQSFDSHSRRPWECRHCKRHGLEHGRITQLTARTAEEISAELAADGPKCSALETARQAYRDARSTEERTRALRLISAATEHAKPATEPVLDETAPDATPGPVSVGTYADLCLTCGRRSCTGHADATPEGAVWEIHLFRYPTHVQRVDVMRGPDVSGPGAIPVRGGDGQIVVWSRITSDDWTTAVAEAEQETAGDWATSGLWDGVRVITHDRMPAAPGPEEFAVTVRLTARTVDRVAEYGITEAEARDRATDDVRHELLSLFTSARFNGMFQDVSVDGWVMDDNGNIMEGN